MMKSILSACLSTLLLSSAFAAPTEIDDFESGDLSSNVWTIGGYTIGGGSTPPSWNVASNVVNSGTYSAQAPYSQGDDQVTYIELALNLTANNQLSFWYNVSSEDDFDFFYFYVDGSVVGSWSGDLGWQQFTYDLFAGNRTLRWEYVKDESFSSNDDTVYIDEITLTGMTFPEILVSIYDPRVDRFVELESGGITEVPCPVSETTVVEFEVFNPRTAPLSLSQALTLSGEHSEQFAIGTSPVFPVNPQATTTFTVDFSPTVEGPKNAVLNIYTNDEDEDPFEINLDGQALLYTADADSDGLSDAAEARLIRLGFLWNFKQESLVDALFDNSAAAGLYTESQIGQMHVGMELLPVDLQSGTGTLNFKVSSASDLQSGMTPLAATNEQVTVNETGEIEFEFPVPGNTAFFSLEAD